MAFKTMGWKIKVSLFALLLFISFLLIDLPCLTGINSSLECLEIDQYMLYGLKGSLFTYFMLKSVRLLLLIGASFLIGWWIIKPYQELVDKVKKLSRQDAELAPLFEKDADELKSAQEVLDVLMKEKEKNRLG